MLTIRLQRVGKRNSPAYRVVLMDARRNAKSGDFLEILGSYNPQHEGSLSFKKERVSHWLSKGVQTSDTIHNLLVCEKIIDAPKRNIVPPSKLKKLEQASAEVPAKTVAEQQLQKVAEAKEPAISEASVIEEQAEKKYETEG